MNRRHLFLTSCGLSNDMKKKFFDDIGKQPAEVRILYIPTAGIETDGARESQVIEVKFSLLMDKQFMLKEIALA